MIVPNETQDSESVAKHYDSLDPWYRKLWGDHLHHGFWKTGKETPKEAVEALVDLIREEGAVQPGDEVCDIGCGYGATAKRLHELSLAKVTGLSLSKKQLEIARKKDPHSHFILADWLHNTLPSKHFDLALSIESSEHMVDKAKFFQEAYRVLKPQGRLVVCAWLSKETPKPWEIKYLLEPICREGRLPSLGSVSDYKTLMMQAGFERISYEDLTSQVKKTWAISGYRMLSELKNKEFRHFLFKTRLEDRVFAKTVFRILLAYRTKSMRYGIFKAIRNSS
ncbi:MAG: Methyltransferase type 11 [uncultured bacterium]|nr:MAG: Methyltransferase type 11 [uncultured bacterium]OGN55941.1 MAG: hypothetical protein A2796_05940 [Chlamydiae bacterium RIFCSPHIGHO2_01_FULL_44_39]OGN60387.1 MAG: hypothetical protein A3D96_07015 [Chlamydiae bacterium RIFCSPHIGHO2_12_FULL_44_59]OGN66372.1 MAG: hypothetical protein A2978_07075 [Chlamydiae bacterium RIFCSPLOWO2_01_FULL_44_52]OGN69405.1 MAG: hypothetical protein A3I67_06595 [Chlamydiae bacterium RIFCSPLOWO2_02_FULL_45_22]OGN70558.1 MAG: hypothetical protein A3F79_00090 [Ch